MIVRSVSGASRIEDVVRDVVEVTRHQVGRDRLPQFSALVDPQHDRIDADKGHPSKMNGITVVGRSADRARPEIAATPP